MTYFPTRHPASWATATPAEAGLDPEAVAAAVRQAGERETPWARDLAQVVTGDFQERPPWNATLGPVRPRGGPNGLLLRGGRIVAEWGDTTRVDMTFSVAKSYLSILAGLAWDRGLIGDPHEEVRRAVEDGGFEPPHNDAITWHHLLQQTSEWEGVLWDKPDLVDRNRTVAGNPTTAPKGTHRDLRPPGGFWEYNDVFIHARDQARIGLMLLRRGIWGRHRILSEAWIERMLEPCPLNRQYGYLWWLNTGRGLYPSAPAASYYGRGAGGNLTWIDPEDDIVAVLRWTDPAAMDGFMKLVMAALGR